MGRLIAERGCIAVTVISTFVSLLEQRTSPLFFVHDPQSGQMLACECQDFHHDILGWAQRLGSSPDKVVMIFGRTTPMMLAAWFGAILAGKLPAFISFPSHKTTSEAYGEKLANYITRFGSHTFVGEGEDQQTWPSLITPHANQRTGGTLATLPGWQDQTPETPLFLQCSSGTTGLQKAVAISESMLIAQIESYRQIVRLDPENDRIVSWLPLYHDMGLVATFLLPLLTGTPVYYLDPFCWAASPGLLLATMERYRGTLTWLPNFAFSFLCKNPKRYSLAHVRAFINCSEPVSADSFQRFISTYGIRPEQLAVCYALAENVFAATQSEINTSPQILFLDPIALRKNRVLPAGPAVPLGRDSTQKSPFGNCVVSCGVPLANVGIKIQTQPGQDVGAIFLQGPCVVPGYYQSPPLAKEGWLPTGDLGFWHEGHLYLCGRQKDLIIQNGKNIYPQDLEALINDHRDIHPGRVAVVGTMDHDLDTQQTWALVEPERNLSLNLRGEVCRELQSRLNLHFDIVVQVVMVPRGWLRKTSSGKIAREDNLERYLKSRSDKIHLCGDSHVRIFWTNTTSHYNRFKSIQAHWVGLLWSDNWKKTTGFFSELVTQMNPRDPLVVQAGEPECRTIFPASVDPQGRIRSSVAGYRDFFLFLKHLWPGRLAYMTGIPTAPINFDNGDRHWPVVGSPLERYRYQQQFYQAMKALCTELVIHFIDVCTPLIGENGVIPSKYLVDGTHLDPSFAHIIVESLEKKFGVITLEPNIQPPEYGQWDGSYEHFSRLVQNKVRDHAILKNEPLWDRMVSSALLDSLAIVELVTMLNQVCGLAIEPGTIQRSDFESIETMYQKFVLKGKTAACLDSI